jgi:hypothetical protein
MSAGYATVERCSREALWYVRCRAFGPGVRGFNIEAEAEEIARALRIAYATGREDALQGVRDALNVPVRGEGED